MGNYELCDLLLKAEDEDRVNDILKSVGYFNDDPTLWRPFGGVEMNFGQIGNQAADPTPALVEKLINSIDAVLMADCYRAGIDPRGEEAPRSMAEAVEKFFKVKDGRLENLGPTERTKLADRIHFIATGSKTNPSYLVVDKGEGQTPASFENTFLSLNRRNKDDIPFVQGRFNCGGTGVLQFCGHQNYQLIVSRRNPSCPSEAEDSTKELWGFTLVRRLLPASGRKSSMYVYLAPQGKILTFAAPDGLAVLAGGSSKNKPAPVYSVKLPYGSCIKLYNYRWKKKAIVTTEGRYELERFLHSVCLPFRLSETREYKANYYSTTLSGIMATTTEEGNEEGDPNSKFEKDFQPAYGEINLPNIGRLPYRAFLLKEEYSSRNFPHGVYFTLNGQVHGELPANFVTSVLKFDCLSGYLMVSVDCTEMNPTVREDFVMASRDRVRRNEVYDEIYVTLRDELKEHPGLRLHNALRKKKRLEETLADEDKATDYFQEILKSDPTLSSILGIGGRVISSTGPADEPDPFVGKKFPTYFRIIKEPKEGLVKHCPLNRTIRVDFETDAANDYFERADCPGSISFDPPNLCLTSNLWNGKFSTKFQMPYDAKVNDLVTMKVTVSDIERDTKGKPFLSQFTMKGVPELNTPTPPPGTRRNGQKPDNSGTQNVPSLAIPKITEVRREKWEDPFYKFNEHSSVKIINDQETGGYDFFVNIDNKYLINELHRAKEEEKALIKHWFVYGIVLAGLGMLGELKRLNAEAQSEDENENDPGLSDDLSLVGKFCSGVAKVIVPIIRSLHKVPMAFEAAAAA
jgi:hypothetical protein